MSKRPLLFSFIFTVRWICMPVSDALVARHHAWSSWSKTNYAASKSNVNVTGVHFFPFPNSSRFLKIRLPKRHTIIFLSCDTETLLEASEMRGRVALRGPLKHVWLDHGSHSSGAVWESRWPSWAVRSNEPSGFRGRKVILNHASALVSACP